MKTTVMDVMSDTVAKFGSNIALKHKRGGTWETMTWREYYHAVTMTARAFMALGLERGKAVNILGNNCPQWFISDLAAIFAGAVPGGIYATSSAEQCRFIAEHSEADIVVVQDTDQLAKIKAVWADLPDLKAVVLMNGSDADERVYAWEDLAPLAAQTPETALDERIEAQDPDDCCTLIYTSGTTGNPKGVMISHDNATWTARQVIAVTGARPNDEIISYLPLSHIAEQVVSLLVPLTVGCRTWFAESLDRLGDNLREVRPTIFVGVPRVWEKIQAKMVAAGAQNSGLKKKIAAWARTKGLAKAYARQNGEPPPAFFSLAHKLVFSKVHERLGFDRCRLFISTAAPISQDTQEFFMSLDIPITEVYGMSECTGPATVSLPQPHQYRIGWAGPAMAGTEIALGEGGEVLMRGRHVFKGYFKNEEATRATLDADGWLHSGDVGEIDDQGFLKITDRMKELIITAGGENVPPQVLESKYKSIPVLNQVVVLGDRRKHTAALFTLDPDRIADTAAQAGSQATSMAEAAVCPRIQAHLQSQVEQINTSLPRAWGIKRFVVLPQELTIEGGELTPTMKLKRRVIYERYAKEIERLYAE
jgi:long-subunit acyl-CoA synthetase (AMP-forming)